MNIAFLTVGLSARKILFGLQKVDIKNLSGSHAINTLLIVALSIIGLVAICLVIYGLHRFLIALERRGYIYYREKPRGSGAGALFELDKLTRPSVEHVVEAMDTEVESQENDGE